MRPPRAATLAELGLAVFSPLRDFRVRVKVTTAELLEAPYDLIIVAAKHYDLDAAITAIRPAVGPQTTILPLLNGLIHLDRLDAAFLRSCASAAKLRAAGPFYRSASSAMFEYGFPPPRIVNSAVAL